MCKYAGLSDNASIALQMPIEKLFERKWSYMYFCDNGINTIDDLLRFTWGYFKAYPRISARIHIKLLSQLDDLGINLQDYLISLPPEAIIPYQIQLTMLDTGIKQKRDLKKLTYTQIMRTANIDLEVTKNLLAMLEDMDVHHLSRNDRHILDVSDLNNRIKHCLMKSGYYSEFDAIKLKKSDLAGIYRLGPIDQTTLWAWIKHHRHQRRSKKLNDK